MLSFVEDHLRSQLEQDMADRKYCQDELVNMVLSKKLVRKCAKCVIHGCQRTVCEAIRCAIHVAGPPCVDWSPQNSRSKEKRQFGPSFLALLAWCAQRLLIMELVLIHENVLAFDINVLVSCLGAVYCLFLLQRWMFVN